MAEIYGNANRPPTSHSTDIANKLWDEESVLHKYLKNCNEKTGTETLLTALFTDTHWEEHPRQLEGEISADILQILRQFGNVCQAELGINILMI